MKINLRRDRPFLIGAALYLLNIEWIVVPFIFIKFMGLSGELLVIAALLWTTGEFSYWFWFSGWLRQWLRKQNTVNDAVQFGKEEIVPGVRQELKEQTGIFFKIEQWVREHLIEPFREENYRHKRLFKFLKGAGIITASGTLFGLGMAPVPFAAVLGIVFVRSIIKWRPGFVFILLGAWVKVIGFTQGWSYILS